MVAGQVPLGEIFPSDDLLSRSKVCLIGYKRAVVEQRFHGERFDHLKACCTAFRDAFLHSGNSKTTNFKETGDVFTTKPGINFVIYGGSFHLTLSPSGNSFYPNCYGEINFCPFCGAKIEIKETKRVRLVRKTKVVDDGYVEEEFETN